MAIFDKFQQLADARQAMEKSCSEFFNIVMDDDVPNLGDFTVNALVKYIPIPIRANYRSRMYSYPLADL